MRGTITRPLRHDPIVRPCCFADADNTGPSVRQAILARRLARAISSTLERVCPPTEVSGAAAPLVVRASHCGPAGQTTGLEFVLRDPALGACATVVVEPGLLGHPSDDPVCAAAGTVSPSRPVSVETGPDRVQRALFLHHLLEVLTRVHEAGGPRLLLCARPPQEEKAPAGSALILELSHGPASGAVEIALASTLLEHAETLAPIARPQLPALRIHLDLQLGCLRLSYRSLVRLRPGDLLLLPGAFTLEEGALGGPVQLRLSPARVVRGRLDHHNFTVEAITRPRPLAEEPPMSTSGTHCSSPHVEPSAIDGVRVDLQIRLARLPLELEALAALDPGVILPVPEGQDRVELHVEDQVIGRGELVELDGQLAVRITSRSR